MVFLQSSLPSKQQTLIGCRPRWGDQIRLKLGCVYGSWKEEGVEEKKGFSVLIATAGKRRDDAVVFLRRHALREHVLP